jgi:hypothetical protein
MDPMTIMMMIKAISDMKNAGKPGAPDLPQTGMIGGMPMAENPVSAQMFAPMSNPPGPQDPFSPMSSPFGPPKVGDVLRPGSSRYQDAIKEGMAPTKSVFGDQLKDDYSALENPSGLPSGGQEGPGALEKIGMGAEIGGAVQQMMPRAPRPPALPGGGRFTQIDPVSVKFMLRQMARR